ncbi:MAG: hypothetical protein H6707_02440 [Deltaproteobacteria bacterium]|nr:hypothetical protein [Deltaproteobacteria bacterium]
MKRLLTCLVLLTAALSTFSAEARSTHRLLSARVQRDAVSFSVAISHHGQPSQLKFHLGKSTPRVNVAVNGWPTIWSGQVTEQSPKVINFSVPLATVKRCGIGGAVGETFCLASSWTVPGGMHYVGVIESLR